MSKLFTGAIVLVAIAAGAISISPLPHDQLALLKTFTDVSLPILAFGALVKFLCKCRRMCKCSCATKGSCN